MMEVRKCCQHPFLLDGVEAGFVAQQALKQAAAAAAVGGAGGTAAGGGAAAAAGERQRATPLQTTASAAQLVGRCMLSRAQTRVESAWVQLLKLTYPKLHSRFAFKFCFEFQVAALQGGGVQRKAGAVGQAAAEVGRCRLTVSKPELIARLVSAFETKM
jgi:hypothetical protein